MTATSSSGVAYVTIGWLAGLAAMWVSITWISCHFAPQVSESVSAAPGIDASSKTRYGRSEYVWVLPVVVAELKLPNIQRHVLTADFVEGADHAALEDASRSLQLCSYAPRQQRIPLFSMLDVGVGKFAAEFPVSHQNHR